MASSEELTQILPQMMEKFNPDKAEGVDATVQIHLTGDTENYYWIKISDGKAEYGEGQVDNPAMTMHGNAGDFLSIVKGESNPMQAFMSGKLKVSGDMGLAMKMIGMFNLS